MVILQNPLGSWGSLVLAIFYYFHVAVTTISFDFLQNPLVPLVSLALAAFWYSRVVVTTISCDCSAESVGFVGFGGPGNVLLLSWYCHNNKFWSSELILAMFYYSDVVVTKSTCAYFS